MLLILWLILWLMLNSPPVFAEQTPDSQSTCLALAGDLQLCAVDQGRRIRLVDERKQILSERALRTLEEQSAHLRGWLHLPQRQSVLLAVREQSAVYELSYAAGDARIYRGYVHDFRMGEAIAEPLRFTPRAIPLEHSVLRWMELAPDRVLLILATGELALLNMHVRRITSRKPLAPEDLVVLDLAVSDLSASVPTRQLVGNQTGHCVRLSGDVEAVLLEVRISPDGQQLLSRPCEP